MLFLQSNLDCFSGSIQYPLPNKKAAASRLGYGGNAIVFVVFHAGKEFAVKKVRMYKLIAVRYCITISLYRLYTGQKKSVFIPSYVILT